MSHKRKKKKHIKKGSSQPKKLKKLNQCWKYISSNPIIPLIIIVSIVYMNVLWNGFTYDDKFIFKGGIVSSLKNVKWLFSTKYFEMSAEQSYRPIVTLSYMLEYPIWETNPTGYHLTNLILHLLVAVILFKVLILFFDKWAGFAGALIYAIHPLTTEVVNSIGFREDILCALFLLLSVLLYKSFQAKNRCFYLVLSLVTFILSLLSKEMAITLPILLILIDFSFGESIANKKRWSVYSVYFLITILYLILRFKIIYSEPDEKLSYYGGSFITALMSIPKLILTYIQLIIFPHPLSVDRYINPIQSINNLYFWFGLVSIIIIIFAAVKLKKGYRLGILWFLISLLPVLNLVPIYNPFAERYMYIPLIGIAILIASLLSRFRQNIFIWAILVYALIGFSIRTYVRNYAWKNDLMLFSKTVKYPCRPRAFYNLGIAYYQAKEYEKAVEAYNKAIYLKPDYPEAYNNLGIVYNDLKKYDDAIRSLRRSISLNPKNENAYNNLSVSLRLTGKITDSIEASKKAIEVNPDYVEGYINLGLTYVAVDDFGEAMNAYNKAIEIDGNSFNAFASLGNLYFLMNNYDEAIKNYQRAIEIKPESSLVCGNLGVAFERLKKYKDAVEYYEKAILLDKNNSNALNNLAWLLTTSEDENFKNPSRAVELAEKACQLTNYRDSEKLDTLAEAYASMEDYDKALEYELEANAFALDNQRDKLEKQLIFFREKKASTNKNYNPDRK